jgi:hypothetical protein
MNCIESTTNTNLKSFHEKVEQSNSLLRITKSTIKDCVSSHVLSGNLSLSKMSAFYKLAVEEQCGKKSFIGSVMGDLILSVNISHRESIQKNKKRKADTYIEAATHAVGRIQKCTNNSESISDKTYEIAINTVSELLKIKGACEENAIESWALSLRKKGEFGYAPSIDGRSSLVVAARIAAGVPISLSSLSNALHACKDGMITIENGDIIKDFDLPMTKQCKESHNYGQKSLLLLVSIPSVDPVIL